MFEQITPAQTAALRAKGVYSWIKENPQVQNINSVETLSVGLDVLMNPSAEGKAAAQGIWETRRANAEVFCQATEDSAYTALMDAVIYGEEVPAGLAENRAYVEKVFGVNVYARIAKAEGRTDIFSNPSEFNEIVAMRNHAVETLDPEISKYTDAMLKELQVALLENRFENVSVKQSQR